jgi:hypothetical protein
LQSPGLGVIVAIEIGKAEARGSAQDDVETTSGNGRRQAFQLSAQPGGGGVVVAVLGEDDSGGQAQVFLVGCIVAVALPALQSGQSGLS